MFPRQILCRDIKCSDHVVRGLAATPGTQPPLENLFNLTAVVFTHCHFRLAILKAMSMNLVHIISDTITQGDQ